MFDENINLPETTIDGVKSLTNGRVANSLKKYQYVSSDLSTMPEIGAAYQFGNYECTRVVRSEDGKTVTLYYKFNNNHYLCIHLSTLCIVHRKIMLVTVNKIYTLEVAAYLTHIQ